MESDKNIEFQEAIPGYKMFIGGLEPSVEAKDLQDYFSQFGEITWLEVIGKKKKSNKGYAFIKFRRLSDLKTILKSTHSILGREVDCKLAKTDSSVLPKLGKPESKPTGGKIFIPQVPKVLKKEDIRRHFS